MDIAGHAKDIAPTQRLGEASRPGQVSNVSLYGIHIVSLWMDGQQRLCLAQISNTLLKRFSYNEIHNRRVALGITCVQCTPVQLEVLRRAGAMPVSSRRCGMITLREAQRLVKSFLEETCPPKLSSDFRFQVRHQCGWGCRGQFIPARYNSSRAKCVQCQYCSLYFSPNKFIFHHHRLPDSTYKHPDAANFNSWRRHLLLKEDSEERLVHAWEDVKAMFNGGSRRRILASAVSRHRSQAPVFSNKYEERSSTTRTAGLGATTCSEVNLDASVSSPESEILPIVKPVSVKLPIYNQFTLPPQYYADFASSKGVALPSGMVYSRNHESGMEISGEPLYPSYEMIWARHLGLSHTPQSLHKCFVPYVLHNRQTSNASPTTSENRMDNVGEKSQSAELFRPYALGCEQKSLPQEPDNRRENSPNMP